MNCDLDNSIPEWLIEHPESRTVFQALGFDESCGGKSLEYLCQQQGFSPVDVLHQLEQAIQSAPGETK
ncbi:hypothetical protein Pla110_07940 [Polystyrenella longa]|uniref:DUF1858 domain-containing protein n=1 Tax=Polystyrenella longa TaxID=2528007 RepID=A0A518CIP7_9PLAN|nr:hypothetical protein [Polystyrenella longa]QDU79090.1 hypothetical protein Pla110_07940 [Polystyrenella longa]